MKTKKTSLKGLLLRELIADITSTSHLGEAIQTGTYRAKHKEPPFLYSSKYHCEKVNLEQASLEYLKKNKKNSTYIILQLHGGGYIGAMKNAYRRFSISYLEQCNESDVVTLDYRVAPNDPFPAALEDALSAYFFITKEKHYSPSKVILAGDSAGGGLALALSMYLRNHNYPCPAGLILMSPWADLTNSGQSHIDNFELDPLFGKTKNNLLYNSSYIGDYNPKNPYISPLFGDFSSLPPTLIQVGTHEVLLSDAKSIAKKLKQKKIPVRLSIYEGMFHVFQMSGDLLPESRNAWDEIGRFFKTISISDTKQ